MTTDNLNNGVEASEVSALKNQIFVLLVAMVVISGTLMVYLYRQASMAGKDRDQLTSLTSSITQNEQAIGSFAGNLVAFGAKHPDFLPVLKKYGLTPAPGMPGVGK